MENKKAKHIGIHFAIPCQDQGFEVCIPTHMQTDALHGDSEGSLHKASRVMVSCPGEYILSVSHMMRSLYMGHKFHTRTQATTINVMP